MITPLLLALCPVFQSYNPPPINVSHDLSPITHNTDHLDPLRHIYKQDVPGFVRSVTIKGEITPNMHMTWTNPSIFNRTVRLVLDYDVWHEPEPGLEGHKNPNSIIDDTVPPTPEYSLGSLVHVEGPWVVVAPGQQMYLWLDTPVYVSKVYTIPTVSDSASIAFGNANGIPVSIEELNVGTITDGLRNWVYSDITLGFAPGSTGTAMILGYSWFPLPFPSTTICARKPATIGGVVGSVWAQAWDLPTVGTTTSIWIESSNPTPIIIRGVLCTSMPWIRRLETLSFVGATGETSSLLETDAVPGDQRFFQLVYFNSISGRGTSDCIEVVFN